MEEAIIFAKKYLEDVLSFFGLNVDVRATHDEDVIELNIPSTHLNGFLIGQHGDTVYALQYLVMNALKTKTNEMYRVNVDVAEYKKAHRDQVAEQAVLWVEDVKRSAKDYELRPMSASDRRVVHQVAGEYGMATESIGEGRNRRVVIKFQDLGIEEEVVIFEEPKETAAEEKPKVEKPAKKESSKSAEPKKKSPKSGATAGKSKKVSKAKGGEDDDFEEFGGEDDIKLDDIATNFDDDDDDDFFEREEL